MLRMAMEAAKELDRGFYYCRAGCQGFHLTSKYSYWSAVRRMVRWRLMRKEMVEKTVQKSDGPFNGINFSMPLKTETNR